MLLILVLSFRVLFDLIQKVMFSLLKPQIDKNK